MSASINSISHMIMDKVTSTPMTEEDNKTIQSVIQSTETVAEEIVKQVGEEVVKEVIVEGKRTCPIILSKLCLIQ
jgi:hypothetical protein